MSNVIYFPNLRAAGNRAVNTGTEITDQATVDHTCLDIAVYQKSGETLSVLQTATESILLQDIHDAASVAINDVSGAFVNFGAAVTIPALTKFVQISSTCGEPIQISFSANLAGAAASTSQVYMVPGGSPGVLQFIPGANNKVFIRSLSASGLTDGYVTINFMG